jgi:hypothetical protein
MSTFRDEEDDNPPIEIEQVESEDEIDTSLYPCLLIFSSL